MSDTHQTCTVEVKDKSTGINASMDGKKACLWREDPRALQGSIAGANKIYTLNMCMSIAEQPLQYHRRLTGRPNISSSHLPLD